jgi:hypothetical protein
MMLTGRHASFRVPIFLHGKLVVASVDQVNQRLFRFSVVAVTEGAVTTGAADSQAAGGIKTGRLADRFSRREIEASAGHRATLVEKNSVLLRGNGAAISIDVGKGRSWES